MVKFRNIILLVAMAAGAAMAQAPQNSDWSMMAGTNGMSNKVVIGTNGIVTSSAGAAFTLGFGHQIAEAGETKVWLELPWTMVARSTAAVGAGIRASTNFVSYFMPGVRFQYAVSPRVSVYGVGGAGFASATSTYFLVNTSAESKENSTFTLGGNVGGGVDFRVTRLLSIRAEARDYITKKNYAGVEGSNHPLIQVGVAFHF